MGEVLRKKEANRSSLFYREAGQCKAVCGPPAFDQITCFHPELIPRHSSFTQQMQAISERMQMILNPDSAAVVHPGAHHVTMQALCNAGMINQHFSDVEDADAWPPMEWSPDKIANVKSFDDAIQNALLPKQREVLRHTHGDEVL